MWVKGGSFHPHPCPFPEGEGEKRSFSSYRTRSQGEGENGGNLPLTQRRKHFCYRYGTGVGDPFEILTV